MSTSCRALLFCAIAWSIGALESIAQVGGPYTPGESYFGRNNYIEYIAGDSPVVISAPHGGRLTPAEIPDRTFGVTGSDTNTDLLAEKIVEVFHARTGKHPHVIISRLHRIKLDPNREIVEAAQGNEFAEQAWHEWHAFIDDAKARVVADYGSGNYIDLHGHGHPIGRIELGYLLSSTQLQMSDAAIEPLANQSSIRTLSATSPATFAELLRGPSSFGALLEERGIPVVPGPTFPDPGAGNPYFTGGYNTQVHGSRDGGPISGFQIECHFAGVRDNDANRTNFARVLTEALEIYLPTHYGVHVHQRPILRNRPAGNRTASGATLRGELLFDGDLPPTVLTMHWGAADGGEIPGAWADAAELGARLPGPVGAEVSGLAPGRYYYRLFGENEIGGAWASVSESFLTVGRELSTEACWRLDGDALDETAAHHGAIVGDPVVATGHDGVTSGSLNFDQIDDHVRIPDFSYTAPGDAEFTLSFWFKIADLTGPQFQYVFSHGDVNGANSLNVYLPESAQSAAGVLRTRLWFAGGDRWQYDVPAGLANGAWHHYALAVSPTGGPAIYIDGTLEASSPSHVGQAFDPAGDIFFAARQDLNVDRFYGGAGADDGLLDDVCLYSRALDLAGVAAIFGGGSPMTSAPQVATLAAESIGATSATPRGELLSDGLHAGAETILYWGETDGGTTAAAWDNAAMLGDLLVGPFGAPIQGLTPERTYRYRAFARNATGETWAAESMSFTTSTPPPTSRVAERRWVWYR